MFVSRWHAPLERLRDERGSILVSAAIAALALALIGGAVVEVGQWFEHRRHIQMRADAAALAGAQLFNECFDTSTFTPAAAAADMENWAKKYGGEPNALGGPVYNRQFGSSASNLMSFQSSTYPAADNPTPSRDLGEECNQLMLDVKLTQAGIPHIFGFSPLATVHGWARVQLQSVKALKPSLALAIPSFDVSDIGVTFVDESNNGVELSGCSGAINGKCTYELTAPPPGSSRWTLPPAQIHLPSVSGSAHLIGMRIAVGNQIGSCAQTTGTSAYACIDLGNTTDGALAIRDYPATQSGYPRLSEVWPSSLCSSDGSPFFSDLAGATSCDVRVQAKLDAGSGSANPETSTPGMTLTATIPNASPSTVTLHAKSYDASKDAWLWQGSTTIPVDAAGTQSEYPIDLSWTSTTPVGGKTKGDFGVVQRFTSATDDGDGPVKMASLSDPHVTSPYSETPGDHSIGVSVVLGSGVPKHLSVLRGSHNGSSTSFLLCVESAAHPGDPYNPEGGDPGIEDGLTNGCSFAYQLNATLTCPDPNNAKPLPADCVPNKPSSDEGSVVARSLNTRFGCTTGSPHLNNWPNYSTPGDPRAVTLLLTTYGAFYNNGSQSYPVAGFGDFYITGFGGSQCPGDIPANAKRGDIWGYFIKYSHHNGVPSGNKCDPSKYGSCIAVLTR